MFNPLYYPEILERPFRRSGTIDSTPNLPVLGLVLAIMRPSTYYEIGVLFGDSYFYACQLLANYPTTKKTVGIDLFDGTDMDCRDIYSRALMDAYSAATQ